MASNFSPASDQSRRILKASPSTQSTSAASSAEAAVAIHTHRLCILTITIAMITYVTGAATASEMKAVTTGRTVIQMSDRPLVTFPAAACTGHYP